MTITVNHTCLADGTRQRGSYLDCDACRTALIKSFGEPVGDPVSETSREVSPGDARRCPWCPGHPVYGMTEHELSLIRDHVRNVHPDHFPGWAGQESDPDDPVTRCAYCGNPHHESRCGFCRYDNEHWE